MTAPPRCTCRDRDIRRADMPRAGRRSPARRASTLCRERMQSRLMPKRAEGAERIDDARRPVDAGDQSRPTPRLPPCRRASRRRSRRRRGCRRRRSPRSCGNRSSPSRSRAAAKRASKCSRPMMPSKAGCTGLEFSCIASSSLPLHAGSIRPSTTRRLSGSRARPRRVEHRLLLGALPLRPRNSATNSRTVRIAAIVGIVRDIGCDQALEALEVVPVRRGRIGRLPLRPGRRRSP